MNHRDTKAILENFAPQVSTFIFVLSNDSDDWRSQLKTYRNIELSHETYSKMAVWNQAMLLDLFTSRVEDLLTPDELDLLTNKVLNGICFLVDGVNYQKGKSYKRSPNYKIIRDIILAFCELRKNSNKPIPTFYTSSFAEDPKKIFRDFFTGKMRAFEEENFRIRLQNALKDDK